VYALVKAGEGLDAREGMPPIIPEYQNNPGLNDGIQVGTDDSDKQL